MLCVRCHVTCNLQSFANLYTIRFLTFHKLFFILLYCRILYSVLTFVSVTLPCAVCSPLCASCYMLYTMSCTTLSFDMQCCVLLCYAVLCCTTSCYAKKILCAIVLYCVMLCYFVICCTVLCCYVVQCCSCGFSTKIRGGKGAEFADYFTKKHVFSIFTQEYLSIPGVFH